MENHYTDYSTQPSMWVLPLKEDLVSVLGVVAFPWPVNRSFRYTGRTIDEDGKPTFIYEEE